MAGKLVEWLRRQGELVQSLTVVGALALCALLIALLLDFLA